MFSFISVYQRIESFCQASKLGFRTQSKLLCWGLLRNLRKKTSCLKFPTKLVNLKSAVCV